MRSASTDSKTPYNYAHTSTPKAAWSHRYTAAKKKGKPTAAAPVAQTRYLSSPAAATLHGKTQGFVLRLPPQNRALATSCSHSNAICKHRFQNTLYLRTHKHTQSSLKPPLHCGKKKRQTDRSRTRRTDEVPFLAGCSHFTRKNTRFRAPASSPKQSPCNIMQPFQCDLQAQIPKHPITTHTQAHPKQLEATVTLRQKKKANRPQPHPSHRRGTFHRRLQPLYTEKHKVSCSGFLPKTEPLQHHAAIPMRSASTDSKTPYTYAHTSTPKAAWSHRYTAAKKKANRPQPHPSHRRGTFPRRLQPLYTEKHKVSCSGFLPKTEPLQHHAAIPMRSASTDSKTPYNYAHTSTPKAAWSHRYTAAKKKANRPQPHPSHRRGTFHRRLQPLYTEKHKVSCSGFLPKTEPLQHHAAIPMRSASTDSKNPITTHTQAHPKQLPPLHCGQKKRQTDRSRTRRTHEVPFIAGCSHFTRKNTRFRAPASSPTHHFPSSPLPIVTTSHRHRLPSSLLPFLTTSLPHHFPSSPLPFVTTSLRHHFPSSPLPIVTTFPSSPLPFVTTPLHHHFPSSPLPFVTTSLLHHFPSSPLPFVTTPLHHHFLKVNFIASYSFVMYWYIMYCYIMYCCMIYHPSSRSISLLLIGLWCIGTLCIVTGSTTLHHSQLHQVKSHS